MVCVCVWGGEYVEGGVQKGVWGNVWKGVCGRVCVCVSLQSCVCVGGGVPAYAIIPP